MFGADVPELGAVLELEDEIDGRLDAEFLLEPARHGLFHPLSRAGVRTTAIGPVSGPQSLALVALLEQQFSGRVEHEHRERPMQYSAALVAGPLVEESHRLV